MTGYHVCRKAQNLDRLAAYCCTRVWCVKFYIGMGRKGRISVILEVCDERTLSKDGAKKPLAPLPQHANKPRATRFHVFTCLDHTYGQRNKTWTYRLTLDGQQSVGIT